MFRIWTPLDVEDLKYCAHHIGMDSLYRCGVNSFCHRKECVCSCAVLLACPTFICDVLKAALIFPSHLFYLIIALRVWARLSKMTLLSLYRADGRQHGALNLLFF